VNSLVLEIALVALTALSFWLLGLYVLGCEKL
jgi:hypothetical protein